MAPRLSVGDSLEEARSKILASGYDAIIVGSDTVWDTRPETAVPRVPNIYSLPGCGSIIRASFAASMDKGGPHRVTTDIWGRLIEEIAEFDFISVRDERTQFWLMEGGVPADRIQFMPDPTIIHDFESVIHVPEEFREKHPRLAVVAVPEVRLQLEATRQLKQMGFEVLNLLCSPVNGQLSAPPDWTFRERLGAHSLFEVVVTDRFHGSIFTLKQNPSTPILMIEPAFVYPDCHSKGRDLFQRLGLSSMVWRYENGAEIPENLIEEKMAQFHEQKIDVAARFSRMQEQARESLQALRNSLM
jgi:hypothetical protein